MKEVIVRKAVILLTLVIFVCIGSISFAAEKKTTSGKFNQGTQGKAKEGLEDTAGKKIEDVKVPEVPKPTPVDNYDVKKSTSSSEGKNNKKKKSN